MAIKKLLGNHVGRVCSVVASDVRVAISSKVSTKRHMLLFDWDSLPLSQIQQVSKRLIKKHNLPAVYIFHSSKGHRVGFCFKLMPFKRYASILSESCCCVDFRYCSIAKMQYGAIRVTKKSEKSSSYLKLLSIVGSKVAEELEVKQQVFNILRCEYGADKSILR